MAGCEFLAPLPNTNEFAPVLPEDSGDEIQAFYHTVWPVRPCLHHIGALPQEFLAELLQCATLPAVDQGVDLVLVLGILHGNQQ